MTQSSASPISPGLEQFWVGNLKFRWRMACEKQSSGSKIIWTPLLRHEDLYLYLGDGLGVFIVLQRG